MEEPYYVENCVKEVRASVFGRDMRKPLADGIEGIRSYFTSEGISLGDLSDVSLVPLHDDYYRLQIDIL